jgi:hypothetical protein
MASNENWVAPVGPHERRYAISNTSSGRLKDKAYFDALYREIESGGLAAMLYDLLEAGLSDWHPRYNIPETEAQKEQARRSLSPEMKWLLSLMQDGRIPDPTTKPNRTTMVALLESARQAIGRKKAIGDQEIADLIKMWSAQKVRTNKGNTWEFPPLAEMRARFDNEYGKQDWGEPSEWEKG